MNVGVGGTGVGVAVGGMGVAVGGTGVNVGVGGIGVGVAVGGMDVGVDVGGMGVGSACSRPHATENSTSNGKPIICSNFWCFIIIFAPSFRVNRAQLAMSCVMG